MLLFEHTMQLQLTGHSAKTVLYTFLQSLNGNLENLMFMVKAIQDALQQSFFFLQGAASTFSAYYTYKFIISSLFLLVSLELLKIMVFLVLIVPVKSLSYLM